MSDVKVVVDCSGGMSVDPGREAEVQGRVLALMREGLVEDASRVLGEFEASRAPGNVAVVPLTPADVEQRERDAAAWEESRVAGLRAERDALLAASDWRVLPDAPTPHAEVVLWLDYRQSLRDLDYTNPDVVFPEAPK
jgi:hypothetical protein